MPSKKEYARFLIEEFKENWAYLRHIGNIRLKHTDIYLVVTGVFTGLLYYVTRIVEGADSSIRNSLQVAYNESWPLIFIAAIFIFLYGFFLCKFIAHQKRGYEHYRIVNSEIRQWFITEHEVKDEISFEVELSRRRSPDEIRKSTFLYWFYLPASINSFYFGLACFVTIDRVFLPEKLHLSLILSIILCAIIFSYQKREFVKLNRNVEVTPG